MSSFCKIAHRVAFSPFKFSHQRPSLSFHEQKDTNFPHKGRNSIEMLFITFPFDTNLTNSFSGNWWNSEHCFDGDHTNSSTAKSHFDNSSKSPVEEYWE